VKTEQEAFREQRQAVVTALSRYVYAPNGTHAEGWYHINEIQAATGIPKVELVELLEGMWAVLDVTKRRVGRSNDKEWKLR
jgi:hypothetical protein